LRKTASSLQYYTFYRRIALKTAALNVFRSGKKMGMSLMAHCLHVWVGRIIAKERKKNRNPRSMPREPNHTRNAGRRETARLYGSYCGSDKKMGNSS
jgi:hypothetical protein